MSDNTIVAESPEVVEENHEENSEGTIALQDKGAYVLNLECIDDGRWKGFKFYVPQFKTLAFACEHFTKLSAKGKDGDEVVLGLVNAAMKARMRSKANSLLTINKEGKTQAEVAAFIAERQAWLNDPVKSILVDETEASEYVPGERETNSLSGLLKQKNDLLKAIKAFKDAGEIDKAKEQKAKYIEVSNLIAEMQAAQDAEVLEAL